MQDGQKKVIALGFFDGVHRGHAELLSRAAGEAQRRSAIPAVITFDQHPEALIIGNPISLINSPSDRAELMRTLYGIKEVIFVHFDEAMMHMPWESFIDAVLIGEYNAEHLVAGHDYHFGYKGEGNAALLRAYCKKRGIGCDIIPKVELHGITVSSTYIRKLIAQGDMERAREFLGHAHMMSGAVVTGNRLGRTIGFPTINIPIPSGVIMPARGVYATRTLIGEASYPSVTNIGVRPTVSANEKLSMETYIIGFSGNLYSMYARVEFYKFIRPEQRFSDLSDLKARIATDIEDVCAYFGLDG